MSQFPGFVNDQTRVMIVNSTVVVGLVIVIIIVIDVVDEMILLELHPMI